MGKMNDHLTRYFEWCQRNNKLTFLTGMKNTIDVTFEVLNSAKTDRRSDEGREGVNLLPLPHNGPPAMSSTELLQQHPPMEE